MTRPVLYHVPPSFYSQIVRLALAEKAVDYESCYVIPGPSSYESYEPWYMRLNPGGTVPTLVDEGQVFADSRDILRHLDNRFPFADLPAGQCGADDVDRLVESLYSISFRELSYGSPLLCRLGVFINSKRVDNLHLRQMENPQLSDIYADKIRDIEIFSGNAVDDEHMRLARWELKRKLDHIDAVLTGQAHLAGTHYTMADLVWTVGIARLIVIGLNPCEHRPALQAWYDRMKARPSFREAVVMERFKPSAILRVLWSKLKARLAGRTNVPVVAPDH